MPTLLTLGANRAGIPLLNDTGAVLRTGLRAPQAVLVTATLLGQ
jgi:hypothetical protein